MAKSIQFTDTELLDLQKFYSLELEKAEKRVQELKTTLAKLGVSEAKVMNSFSEEPIQETEEITASKTGKKKKSKKSQKKPRWGEFIMEYLQSQNRLLRVGSIIEEATEQFDIAEEEQKATEQAIYNGLNRLQKVNHEVIGYIIPGRKGRYYGLKNWFTEAGVPKEEYLNKSLAESGS